MYIYDNTKSLVENNNMQALVEAQEEVARNTARQNGQVEQSGETIPFFAFIGNVLLFIGWSAIIGTVLLGVYLGIKIVWAVIFGN